MIPVRWPDYHLPAGLSESACGDFDDRYGGCHAPWTTSAAAAVAVSRWRRPSRRSCGERVRISSLCRHIPTPNEIEKRPSVTLGECHWRVNEAPETWNDGVVAKRNGCGLCGEIDRFPWVIIAERRNSRCCCWIDQRVIYPRKNIAWILRARSTFPSEWQLRVVWCALPTFSTPMEICANHGLMHVGNCSMEDISVSIIYVALLSVLRKSGNGIYKFLPPLPRKLIAQFL